MDLSSLGKTPIAAENASGADVRYDSDFEAIQAEIDKLSSPTAASQVDWERVVQNATAILGGKSKDLTIACYLAVAWVCTSQVDGLDQGLQVLGDIVETYWDTLYPPKKRMRGRTAAVQWWLEKTQVELEKLNPPPSSPETVQRMLSNLKRFDDILAANMPEAPVLRPLQRQIESLPVQGGESSAAPASVSPDREPSGAKSTVAAAPIPRTAAANSSGDAAMSGDIGSDGESRRAADAAFQRLRQISLYLLNNDAKNPLAYRYRRIAAWARLNVLPVHTEGTTRIVAPAPQVTAALDGLREEGNLPGFIQNAEQKLSQYIFWFDLNRRVAEALNDLGGEYQMACAAVCQETAGLLHRLPELSELRFSDGTPFADTQTRQWLQSIQASTGSTAVSTAAPGGNEEKSAPDAMLQDARALARKKKLVEAVGLLQQQMHNGASHRQAMQWRLAIARLLIEAKKPQQALPHIEQILVDIDGFHLESWEPGLSVEAFTLAWQGFSLQNGNEHKSRAAELLVRIARIDPVAALKLT